MCAADVCTVASRYKLPLPHKANARKHVTWKAYRAAVFLLQRQAELDMTMHKQERDAIQRHRGTTANNGMCSILDNVIIMGAGLAGIQKAL